MELWTRRILLPVFHRPPLEVHALLVDRLQPQILIIEFAKTALPGAAPPVQSMVSNLMFPVKMSNRCIVGYPMNHPRHYCTYYLFCLSLLITQNLLWVWTYNYSHHYNSWNSLFPTPTYHIVRVIGLSFSQRICSKIAWQIRISPISSKIIG